MDRDRPLPAALRLADAQQPPLEVDVVPVEAEQLAAAQAGEGKQGEQQPVALALAAGSGAPTGRRGRSRASRRASSRWSSTSGSTSRFFGVRSDERRVALQVLVLDTEAEEALERRHRARLARRRRPPLRLARRGSARRSRRPHRLPVVDALAPQEAQAGRHVALVGRAGQRREPPLQPAVAQEIGQTSVSHRPSFGQAAGPCLQPHDGTPAYRPATEKPRQRGFSMRARRAPDSPARRCLRSRPRPRRRPRGSAAPTSRTRHPAVCRLR